MFAVDNDERNECSNNISNNIKNNICNNSSNNICNNSSTNGSMNSRNNNGNNSASSVKALTANLSDSSRLQPTKDGAVSNSLNVSVQLPRSRLSIFAPTPLRPAASAQSSPLSIGCAAKTSNCNPTESSLSSGSISRLDSSLVKNGTVISSMVTYANSIRDTVEGAIASQQGSIESKLGEISGFLSVLPSLTQKIGDLESKVDSLEALLVDRNKQIAAIANECEQIREIVNKQTVVFDTKFVALEKNFTSTVKSISQYDKNVHAVSSVTSPSSSGTDTMPLSIPCIEIPEILVTGFIDREDCNLTKAALAAFRAVSKLISVDDIVSCRRSTATEQQGSSVKTSNTRPPHFFMRLRSSSTANNIINAKRKYNLLHTQDLDQSLLDPADRPNVINTKIVFNEVLEKNKYKHFQNLKITGKKLGFKYEAFHVKCPSARRANPKSCYF